MPDPALDPFARIASLEAALRPFANAALRVNYYAGERYNGSLYAMVAHSNHFIELLDGIDGYPLYVADLRKALEVLGDG